MGELPMQSNPYPIPQRRNLMGKSPQVDLPIKYNDKSWLTITKVKENALNV